jgi:hypothetical protein
MRSLRPRTARVITAAVGVIAGSSLSERPPSDAAAAELDRVFVGVPTQLTLPPCFPAAVTTSCSSECDSDPPKMAPQYAERENGRVEDGEPALCPKDQQQSSREKSSVTPESASGVDASMPQTGGRSAR